MLPKFLSLTVLLTLPLDTPAISIQEAAGLEALAELTNVRDVTSIGWETPPHSTPYCEWEGVSCSGNVVNSLDLAGLGLTGTISTISPAIQNLTNLSDLDFSFNKLIGNLDSTLISKCRSSVSCDFSANKLDCGGDFQILVAGEIVDSDIQSCVFCRNCLKDGGCANGYSEGNSAHCDVCPSGTFEKGGVCNACENEFSGLVVPVGVFCGIACVVCFLNFLCKRLKVGPNFSLAVHNLIRYKQFAAVSQMLLIFSTVVGLQAPWFLNMTNFLTQLSVPFDIASPCFWSAIGDLSSGPYYFMMGWVILGGVALLVFIALHLHRIPGSIKFLGLGFFENVQKVAAVIVIQLPVVVIFATLKPTMMFNDGASIYGLEILEAPAFVFFNFLSLILIIFTMQRSLKKIIRRSRRMREALIQEMEDIEEEKGEEEAYKVVVEDIDRCRPFLAMFGIQYVTSGYGHEEKAFVQKVGTVILISTIRLCTLFAMDVGEIKSTTYLENTLLGACQACAFILVNWVYLGDMIKRPYVSHNYGKRRRGECRFLGNDIFNDSEVMVVRFSSWFLAGVTVRLVLTDLLNIEDTALLENVSCGVLVLGMAVCLSPLLKKVTAEVEPEGERETQIVEEINRILESTSFRESIYFSRACSSSVKYDSAYSVELKRWPVSPPEEPHICNILGCCCCARACRKDIHACVNHNCIFKPLSWMVYVMWLSLAFWIVASAFAFVYMAVNHTFLGFVVCPAPLFLCVCMEIRIFRDAGKWKDLDVGDAPDRESFHKPDSLNTTNPMGGENDDQKL
ncbi:hypothetical protein TL16_g04885 [Triparma laevis f. inornata]|uniref:Leucine-rich repeat-containing N-terminal plant-type domain-containing protein n=1 Tax=Triparma laevis f. inornata TaxID=1714386 RepID=A0A9W7AE23_9STRA|nr:hypothetical protein TL16_g04885 [Triparma laevis f. inornata]